MSKISVDDLHVMFLHSRDDHAVEMAALRALVRELQGQVAQFILDGRAQQARTAVNTRVYDKEE